MHILCSRYAAKTEFVASANQISRLFFFSYQNFKKNTETMKSSSQRNIKPSTINAGRKQIAMNSMDLLNFRLTKNMATWLDARRKVYWSVMGHQEKTRLNNSLKSSVLKIIMFVYYVLKGCNLSRSFAILSAREVGYSLNFCVCGTFLESVPLGCFRLKYEIFHFLFQIDPEIEFSFSDI